MDVCGVLQELLLPVVNAEQYKDFVCSEVSSRGTERCLSDPVAGDTSRKATSRLITD